MVSGSPRPAHGKRNYKNDPRLCATRCSGHTQKSAPRVTECRGLKSVGCLKLTVRKEAFSGCRPSQDNGQRAAQQTSAIVTERGVRI